MSLKIIEFRNLVLSHGDREFIYGVETLEEAREIAKYKLVNEGDHADFNEKEKKMTIKNFGGDSEVRKLVIFDENLKMSQSIYTTFLATHGTIL